MPLLATDDATPSLPAGIAATARFQQQKCLIHFLKVETYPATRSAVAKILQKWVLVRRIKIQSQRFCKWVLKTSQPLKSPYVSTAPPK
jgi:hypothetical protein